MTSPALTSNTLPPTYLLKGFSLLTHKELRSFIIFPLLVNFLLFIALGAYAVNSFNALLDNVMAYIPQWLDFLSWILWLLFAALMLFVYGYSFALIGNIIASPFYGLLSERVEMLTYGKQQLEPFSWKAVAKVALQSFQREAIKLLYFVPRLIGILLLTLIVSFIPVVNILAPAIAFLWGSWSLSLQYLDYTADNNQQSFTKLRQQAKLKRFSALSFGGATLLATSIPVLNMLTIPAAVVGATLMWHDRINDQPTTG